MVQSACVREGFLEELTIELGCKGWVGDTSGENESVSG